MNYQIKNFPSQECVAQLIYDLGLRDCEVMFLEKKD